jgi:hypothetical protein
MRIKHLSQRLERLKRRVLPGTSEPELLTVCFIYSDGRVVDQMEVRLPAAPKTCGWRRRDRIVMTAGPESAACVGRMSTMVVGPGGKNVWLDCARIAEAYRTASPGRKIAPSAVFDPHQHDHEEHALFVPTAQPTDPPAIHAVAERHRPP